MYYLVGEMFIDEHDQPGVRHDPGIRLAFFEKFAGKFNEGINFMVMGKDVGGDINFFSYLVRIIYSLNNAGTFFESIFSNEDL